jgi:thioredoxin-related protein
MKKNSLLAFFALLSGLVFSQDLSKFHLYHPEENAEVQIAAAVKKAKAENKHVFIQVGGNWCIWCARFNDLATTDSAIDSLVKASYVVYHLNYSKENENKKILARYGYPQRFGFPVFLVLDGSGKRLHTQNTSYLEQDKGYSREAVIGFLKDWSPAALNPRQYQSNE